MEISLSRTVYLLYQLKTSLPLSRAKAEVVEGEEIIQFGRTDFCLYVVTSTC